MDSELNPKIFSAIKGAIEAHPQAVGINVYLGDHEWESLKALMNQFGAEWKGGAVTYDARTGNRAQFMDCPVFRVDARTHLSVGTELSTETKT